MSEQQKGQMSLDARTPNTGWVASAYRTHMFSVLLFCTSTFYMIRKRGPKGTLALLKRAVSLSEQQKGQMSLDARTPNTGWVASAYRTHMFSVLLFCTSTFYMIRKRGPKGTLALLKRAVSLSEQQKGQMSLDARTPNTGWVASAYRTHMFSVLLFCTSTFYMIRKRGPKGTLALLKRAVSLSEQQKGQMSLDARTPNTGWVASAYRTHMFSVLLFCTSTFYMIRKRGPKGTLALLKRAVSLSEQQKGQMSLDARTPNTGWVASAYRTHMFSMLLFCTSTFYMIRKRGPKGTLALLKRAVSLSEQQKGQMSLDARTPNTGWVASAYRTHMFSVLLFCTSTFYMIRKRGPKGTLALLKRVVSLSEQQKGQMSLEARTPNTGWVASAYRTHMFSVLLFCTSTFYMIRKRGAKGMLALLKKAVSLSEQQKGQMSLEARTPNTGLIAPAYMKHTFSVLPFCASIFCIIRKRGVKGMLALLKKAVSLSEQQRGILLALAAGILDGVALSSFGLATQLMPPGVLSVITSNYTVVCIIFGIFVLGERLVANQIFGIVMVIAGVAWLAYLRP